MKRHRWLNDWATLKGHTRWQNQGYEGDTVQVSIKCKDTLKSQKRGRLLRDDDAKALEKFGGALERPVINLKVNGCQSDLQGGTLYAIILEKIPEEFLDQCYRWIKENQLLEKWT